MLSATCTLLEWLCYGWLPHSSTACLWLLARYDSIFALGSSCSCASGLGIVGVS